MVPFPAGLVLLCQIRKAFLSLWPEPHAGLGLQHNLGSVSVASITQKPVPSLILAAVIDILNPYI